MESLGSRYKISAFIPQKDYFVIYCQDITPEIEQIKDLTTQLETVFNCTQDAMFLVRVENGEFRYIKNNAAHQKLAGYTLEDLSDKTPIEAAGEEIGQILKSNYQRCVDINAPITYEETLPFPAGTRTWLTTLTPVMENGIIKYLVGSRKDITTQKQAEKEREELFNRLQAMFNEHTAIMLLIEPLSGKIVDVNPAACAFTVIPEMSF